MGKLSKLYRTQYKYTKRYVIITIILKFQQYYNKL